MEMYKSYISFIIYSSMDVFLPGSLVMADQVRYMVYRVTREDCSRPDLGWDSFTHTTHTLVGKSISDQLTSKSTQPDGGNET